MYIHGKLCLSGANIDAISNGVAMGISAQNTLNYAPTARGTKALYSSVSNSMRSYRSSGSSRILISSSALLLRS